MLLALFAVIAGLVLVVWSADRFVEGAAATARLLGMPPLLIGMVIVGFGTSAPEIVVSVFAAAQGNPGLALGNAYGSNIANIGLILGLTAVLAPIAVQSQVLRKELPILMGVVLLAVWQLRDGQITRSDGFILLAVFVVVFGWSIWQGLRNRNDALGAETAGELDIEPMPAREAILNLLIGLLLLVLSSRVLVWGAVEIATLFGVSDLLIGLTIVAIGTSLPELAAALASVKKGEHDIAFGNVIGSNLFNTLMVVGLAASVHPIAVDPIVFYRDAMVMAVLTLSLFVFGWGFRGPGSGRINRVEGGVLLIAYVLYNVVLVREAIAVAAF